jgi:predicted kinase
MKNIQTAYLVYGPIGAGKSTYARKLASEKNAIPFAIDEWMHGLFGDDKPEKMDLAWAMTRVARCEARIWATCAEILASGRDVVLELGAMREADRERAKSIVEAAEHRIAFCFVDAEREVRRQRVMQRNKEKGETFSFEVTPAMFDAMDSYFERPTERELGSVTNISGGN